MKSEQPLASQRQTCVTDRRLSVAYRRVSDLTLDPNNPRLHTKKQLRQIAKSIETFGFNVPVLVDGKLKVVAGHGRVQACQLLGIDQVPTISLEHLTEAQARAFMIADNRLTENAEWSDALLAEQFKALSELELDFSLETTGFEVGEIDLMIESLSKSPAATQDPADALPGPTGVQVTQPGDVWQLGRHRICCGDARRASTYSQLIGRKRAAMVFTDPPYNVRIDGNAAGFGRIHYSEFAMASGEMTEAEFTGFLTDVFSQLARHSTSGALHFICMDWRHTAELMAAANRTYTEFKNLCVWVKDTGGQGSLYRSRHELVFVFKSGKESHRNNIQLGQYGRYRTNVWEYSRPTAFGRNTDEGNLAALHPTVKPVQLVADAILDCTARGDIVLDAFLGSGTTVIASERTGRSCYAVELDPAYVDTVVRRWQNFTGEAAVHAVSGRKFSELEAEVKGEKEK